MKATVAVMAGVLMVSGLAVSATSEPVTVAEQAAAIAAGKKIYATQKCQTCHAIEGKGMKLYPLDGVGAKLSAEDIRTWIVNPTEMVAKQTTKAKMKMKAYELEAADLDALVAYLVSLQ